MAASLMIFSPRNPVKDFWLKSIKSLITGIQDSVTAENVQSGCGLTPNIFNLVSDLTIFEFMQYFEVTSQSVFAKVAKP